MSPIQYGKGIATRLLLGDLADQFGTPLFVVLGKVLVRQYQSVLSAFRKRHRQTVIAYSYKTNYVPAICQIFHEQGAWAEVVSGMELEIAQRLGVPGKRIIANGPYKPIPELQRMVAAGCLVNLDSLEDATNLTAVIGRSGLKARVGIRISASVGDIPWSKFGFTLGSPELKECLDVLRVNKNRVLPTAVHIHIGSNVADTRLYREATRIAVDFAIQLERQLGREISILDLGGGFATQGAIPLYEKDTWAVPSIGEYADAICKVLNRDHDGWGAKRILILEPGRLLVDAGVVLLSRVTSVKSMNGRAGLLILDAGVNVLPSAYYRRHKVTPLYRRRGRQRRYDLFGPLCMQADFLEAGVNLPPAEVGDLLSFENAGAYSISHSIQFIRPRPAVVAVGGKRAKVIRRAETTSDILRLDRY